MLRIIFIAILYVTSSLAHSALIDNGFYTSDTSTNYDWLDLTVTKGLSGYDAYNLIAPISDEESDSFIDNGFMGGGWAIANELQIFELIYGNIGSNADAYIYGSSENDMALRLMEYLGITNTSTHVGTTTEYTSGMYINDIGKLDYLSISAGRLLCYPSYCTHAETRHLAISYPLSYSHQGTGFYLLRDHIAPVPIPATLWLFGSALIALTGFLKITKQ